MYRILVADDEIWIRKAIVKRIASSNLPVEIAGEATDGREALELAIQVKPDIIITDIKMPQLNGLEFIARLKEYQPAAKIIIISGYADFEYARTALQLGVSQYILKTIDDENLNDTLEQVIGQIKREKRAQADLKFLQAQLIERTRILQKNFIHQLLSGKLLNGDYIRRMLKNLDLPLDEADRFCIMAAQLREWLTPEQMNRLIGGLQRVLTDEHCNFFICEDQQGFNIVNIILYSTLKSDIAGYSTGRLAQQLIGRFSDCLSLIGISKAGYNITQIKTAYIQAVDALSRLELDKSREGRVLYFGDIAISDKGIDYFPLDAQRNLIYYIESGNHEGIKQQLASIIENIGNNKQIAAATSVKLYFEVILLLEKLLKKHGLSEEQVWGSDFISLVNIYQTSPPQHLENLLVSLAIKAAENISFCDPHNKQALIQTIRTYLDDNYFEDISLDTIAHKFFISKIYFSQQFKKETGVTFGAYLTRIRMAHALQLLKTGSLKVQEVARMVGYSDPLYFGQAFKKYFGVLPSEYVTDNN